MGDGHHGWASAELLMFVRDLLVREVPPAEVPDDGTDEDVLALSTLVPEDWFGQGWEVHDAPTAFGTISYAVRWHGDRVALLWEVEPHPGQGPVRLVSPGLDPTWSTTELRGEALLGPVPAPPPAPSAPVDGVATHATPPASDAGGTIGSATAVSITRSGSGARSPDGGSFT